MKSSHSGVGRPFAEDGAAWVARNEPGEGEHDERDPEQDRDRDEESTDDELDHGGGHPFGWWAGRQGRRRATPLTSLP